MDTWSRLSIPQLQQLMQRGELTSVALVEHFIARIERWDGGSNGLNAVRLVNSQALQQAAALDEERRLTGPRSALHGVPVLVKDNYATVGMPTTAGSILLANHQPSYDAAAVARLKAAGAVILGKTNMHEFAYGITTVGSAFGQTRNPYDPTRNPGGSSGGTGAAIGADFAVFGMGSDTCGSIRIPAAHNNLVGLRGTQGLSSRFGIVPLSHTQDIGGPLARSVEDLAIALDATVGVDVKDEQTRAAAGQHPASYFEALQTLNGLRVGVLSDWLVVDEEDQPVADVLLQALNVMQDKAGWQIKSITSAELNQSLARDFDGHYVLIADFAQDINAYLAEHTDIAPRNLKALLDSGQVHPQVVPSLRASLSLQDAQPQAYQTELSQRKVVAAAMMQLLEQHQLDVLAYPTIRQVAVKLGEVQPGTNCRLAANSGLPAMSIPAGFAGRMPVGLELLAPAWQEQLLLNAALTMQTHHPQRRSPELSAR